MCLLLEGVGAGPIGLAPEDGLRDGQVARFAQHTAGVGTARAIVRDVIRHPPAVKRPAMTGAIAVLAGHELNDRDGRRRVDGGGEGAKVKVFNELIKGASQIGQSGAMFAHLTVLTSEAFAFLKRDQVDDMLGVLEPTGRLAVQRFEAPEALMHSL